MVILVLPNPSQKILVLNFKRLPVNIECSDSGHLWSANGDPDVRDAQATLLEGDKRSAEVQFWIDKDRRVRRLLWPGVDFGHEKTPRNPHLRSRKASPLGFPHQFHHPSDQRLKAFVEDLHRLRGAGENGVRVQDDLLWMCWIAVHERE